MNNNQTGIEQNGHRPKFITELIGDDFTKWSCGDKIILRAGTGTGKSTFCIETLGRYCIETNEKVLYVCNRSALEKDVYTRLEKVAQTEPRIKEHVFITKYQNVESDIRMLKEKKVEAEIAEYKYIFLDECHYFVSDAAMNPYTEVTYNIFTQCTSAILIFASATANMFFNAIQKDYSIPEENIYKIKQDYDFVDNVYTYRKDQLIPIIQYIIQTEPDSKLVVFCKDGNRIMEIYRYFEEPLTSVFCSSGYSDKRVKEIADKRALRDGTFEKRILVTTSVIDNGVDFKDLRIKHIFTELVAMDSLIQSLGRKRPISSEDHCNYYVREYETEEVRKFRSPGRIQLAMANSFKNSPTAFRVAHQHDRELYNNSKIIYRDFGADDDKINEMAYIKYKSNDEMYKWYIMYGFKNVLKRAMSEQLAEKVKKIELPDYEDNFMDYLISIEGVKYYKKDTGVVKKEFENAMAKIGKFTRWFGMGTLNKFIEERYGGIYKKRFESKRDTRRVNGDGSPNPMYGKTYWVLK